MTRAAAFVYRPRGREGEPEDVRVFLAAGEHPGVHWGAALGLPAVPVDPTDVYAPRVTLGGARAGGHDDADSSEHDEAAVAALRGVLLATGAALAEGPGGNSLDAEAQEALRHAFGRSADEGASEFARLGARWRTDRLVRLGRRPARGDAIREDLVVFGLILAEGEALGSARGASATELLGEWAAGRVALADPVPSILRRARDGDLAHFSLDVDDPIEVAPGVHMVPLRTPTLPPAQYTNAFVLGGAEALLVEPASPFPSEVERVVRMVEERRDQDTRFLAIAVTHHHPDHVGGATALSKRLELPLWAHAETARLLEGVVRFDRLLEDGEAIRLRGDGDTPDVTIRCVHTPGHAWGHLCFVDEASRAMIAGDMVAGVGTILVERQDGDMALYLESLARMKALRPSCLLPAHGGIIVDPGACLDHYVAHRLAREEKVADALAAVGTAQPYELVPVAYADTPKMLWPLATRALEAHLLHLVALGRAEELAGDRFRHVDS